MLPRHVTELAFYRMDQLHLFNNTGKSYSLLVLPPTSDKQGGIKEHFWTYLPASWGKYSLFPERAIHLFLYQFSFWLTDFHFVWIKFQFVYQFPALQHLHCFPVIFFLLHVYYWYSFRSRTLSSSKRKRSEEDSGILEFFLHRRKAAWKILLLLFIWFVNYPVLACPWFWAGEESIPLSVSIAEAT